MVYKAIKPQPELALAGVFRFGVSVAGGFTAEQVNFGIALRLPG
jgi:hypothetical protein